MRHVLVRLILASPLLVILLAPWPTQSVSVESYPAFMPLESTAPLVTSAIAKGNPKLESALDQLVEAQRAGGLTGAAKYAADHRVQISGETILVIAQAQPDRLDEMVAAVADLGASIEKTYDNLAQIRCSVALLEAIVKMPSVQFVRQTASLRTTRGRVTTDGAFYTGAFKWHQAGITGAVVKVAVLDGGFRGYQQLLGSDLPENLRTQSFRSDKT